MGKAYRLNSRARSDFDVLHRLNPYLKESNSKGMHSVSGYNWARVVHALDSFSSAVHLSV